MIVLLAVIITGVGGCRIRVVGVTLPCFHHIAASSEVRCEFQESGMMTIGSYSTTNEQQAAGALGLIFSRAALLPVEPSAFGHSIGPCGSACV